MTGRLRWAILGVAMLALAPLSGAIGTVEAQNDETAATSEDTVAIGEFDFVVDPAQPFQANVVGRPAMTDGTFVIWYPAAQVADGSFVGLTPCDNVAILCVPIISPAKAGFRLADPGDHIYLATEGQP